MRQSTRRLLVSFIVFIPSAFAFTQAPKDVYKTLKQLDIDLPHTAKPVANYVPTVQSGNLVFLSGHIPRDEKGAFITGKVGRDLDVKAGQKAARRTAIALLGSLHAATGDLNKVRRIVKVEGMINATATFTDHSKVMNGCSDLLVKIFGDKGRHTRIAVGMASLPLNAAVEISMIVEVDD